MMNYILCSAQTTPKTVICAEILKAKSIKQIHIKKKYKRSLILAAGVAAFKTSLPPPETNGLIGHTTKTLECVPVRRSTC